MDALQARQ